MQLAIANRRSKNKHPYLGCCFQFQLPVANRTSVIYHIFLFLSSVYFEKQTFSNEGLDKCFNGDYDYSGFERKGTIKAIQLGDKNVKVTNLTLFEYVSYDDDRFKALYHCVNKLLNVVFLFGIKRFVLKLIKTTVLIQYRSLFLCLYAVLLVFSFL